MAHKIISNIFHWILLVAFFAAIYAPAAQMMLSNEILYSYTEKRLLAIFPKAPDNWRQTQEFYLNLDNYFDDHFGFREWFIYRYQREVRKYFDTIGQEINVLRGRENWYFLTESRLLQDFTGKYPLSDKELNSWLTSYRERRRWLKERGIHYLMIAPPNKQTVYPEFVMASWENIREKTRLQQLKERLTDSDKAAFIDLAPILLDKKDDDTLFYKSDTHWTPYGAYLAFQVIVQRLETIFPGVSFKKEFLFTTEITRVCDSDTNSCGDLTTMLLDFKPFEESYRNVKGFLPCATLRPFDYQLGDVNTKEDTPSFAKSCQNGQLKAIVFIDSFAISLEQFLSENFAEVIYLWQKYDQENLEKLLEVFRPDIVIEERVERRLFTN